MLLKDKHAFITGGSKGIGLGICKRFLEHGLRSLAYFSRTESPEHAVLLETAEQYQSSVYHYQGSVDDEKALQNSIADFSTKSGSLDILVNNAGITKDKLIIGLSLEDWDSVINTNLKSVFIASKSATQIMLKQRRGVIVNISSVVAIHGNAGQSNYCASKAGVIGFTKSLARETAKRGVRVNAIAPGYIKTEMTDKIHDTYKEKLQELIPLVRIGEAEDIADPCVFLCSDMSRYITGEVLVVSGGM
ncbi:estradiol 17-beta-dehydrogenase 8-like [Ylistrum balloti]|uniref:estradiol 17-beta-dehydrogenase 8-like n=1 Tax=Ylistrum balloti TaxID=509963 RepID=UPI00290594BE|nr:estradiol 17-beta-dehydrogenase 8-like [Ylistrum balloti]